MMLSMVKATTRGWLTQEKPLVSAAGSSAFLRASQPFSGQLRAPYHPGTWKVKTGYYSLV